MNWTEIVIAGVAGYMWAEVLTKPEMAFHWVSWVTVFIARIEGGGRSPLNRMITKPIYTCAVCVTGFWYSAYLIVTGILSGFAWVMVPQVILAMFVAHAIERLLLR